MHRSLIQWPLPSVSPAPLNIDNEQLARYQLDDLKKKLIPIQQMITSLQPKKQISLVQYIPDFESYNDDINDNDVESQTFVETYDINSQESLSERLYKEIDGQTTRIYLFTCLLFPMKYLNLFYTGQFIFTTKIYYSETKYDNNGRLIRYNLAIYLFIVLIYQI